MRRAMSVKAPSKASSVFSRSGSGTDQWIPAQVGDFLVGVVAHGHDEVFIVRHLIQPARGKVRESDAVAAGDVNGARGDAVRGVRTRGGRGDFADLVPECDGQLGPGAVPGADEEDAAGAVFARRAPVPPAPLRRAGCSCGAYPPPNGGGSPGPRLPACAGGGTAGLTAFRVRPAAPWGKGLPGSAGPRFAAAQDPRGPRAWRPAPERLQLGQYSLIQF